MGWHGVKHKNSASFSKEENKKSKKQKQKQKAILKPLQFSNLNYLLIFKYENITLSQPSRK